MTIKPIINENSNESNEDHQNGHKQVDQQLSNNGNIHRNLNNVDNYSQIPQRRSDVFEDLSRHKRSPQKSIAGRQKRTNDLVHGHTERISPNSSLININTTTSGSITKSPKHKTSIVNSNSLNTLTGSVSPKAQLSPRLNSVSNINNVSVTENVSLKQLEETLNGYNSGDEWLVPKEDSLTQDEWVKRDEQFGKAMEKRGLIIKHVEEDGACLFRAISLQIYGDQEMHDLIRQQTMDYISQNKEYFAQFVTEDINNYVQRKRNCDSHGNHIEVQAMSELYNRPVELYCYQTTPINIFKSEQITNDQFPLRLAYQRGSHYNAVTDPYNGSVGVGLGLAGYKPESQTHEAIQLSEQLEIEQTMFEDKLKTTDWEATNEELQEQVARESYLEWCRENILKNQKNESNEKAYNSTAEKSLKSEASNKSQISGSTSSNSTITSAEAVKKSCFMTTSKTIPATSFKNNSFTDSTSNCNKLCKCSVKSDIDNSFNSFRNNSLLINEKNCKSNISSKSDNSVANNIDSVVIENNFSKNTKNKTATTSQYEKIMLEQMLGNNNIITANDGCSSLSTNQCNHNDFNNKVEKNSKNENDQINKLKSEINDSTEHCYDSDDDDMSSTSSIETSHELMRPNPKNYKQTAKNNEEKKSRLKRKYTDLNRENECKKNMFHSNKLENDKKYTKLQKNILNDNFTNSSGFRELKSNDLMPNSNRPGTSKPNEVYKSISTFYQSLLESSYTEDGVEQLTENEMIQKAIHMSRRDFFEEQKLKFGYFQVQHQDNDDDSA